MFVLHSDHIREAEYPTVSFPMRSNIFYTSILHLSFGLILARSKYVLDSTLERLNIYELGVMWLNVTWSAKKSCI